VVCGELFRESIFGLMAAAGNHHLSCSTSRASRAQFARAAGAVTDALGLAEMILLRTTIGGTQCPWVSGRLWSWRRRGRKSRVALIGMGIPECEAKRYEGRIKKGGILFVVAPARPPEAS